MLLVGIALFIVIFIATNTMESSLKKITEQNDLMIELLRDIRDKKNRNE